VGLGGTRRRGLVVCMDVCIGFSGLADNSLKLERMAGWSVIPDWMRIRLEISSERANQQGDGRYS